MTAKEVTKETLKRIISDITQIVKSPLHDNGIYYHHDESNMLRGYVLIIPQNECPYQFGNYFFTLEFPTNYPYSPPSMSFLTNNGQTRFHPNLYRNGRVCLSILNTWKGDKWTSCNTLSSVLLHVATLFTEDPFLHEPGITKKHPEFNEYTSIVEFQNYETAIYGILAKSIILPNVFIEHFEKVVRENFKKNQGVILKRLQEKRKDEEETKSVAFYKMYDQKINYANVYLKLKEYNTFL